MKAALLLLLTLTLAACEGFPPDSGRSEGDRDADAANTPIVQRPVPESEPAQVSEATPKTQPRPPTIKPKRPQVVGDDLIGLTTEQTWGLLAEPATSKRESPATVWTYEHAGCRLELFFYFDLESQEQRTLAFDLDTGSESVGSVEFCLQELVERGRADAAGASAKVAGDGAGKGAKPRSRGKTKTNDEGVEETRE